MRSKLFRFSIGRACAAFLAIGALPSAAVDLPLLHSFDEEDGSYPNSDLVRDAEGNLYGMTVTGGAFGSGTVFRLVKVGENWVHEVLYEFTSGPDGGQPYGGVTLDAEGNVYGTTVVGGTGLACEDGCGTVFKLTRTGSGWSQSTLHSFQGGTDGSGAGGPVTFDHLGNLYGLTPTGGNYGIGTVFQLTPLANGTWRETIIHHFTGAEDGGAGSAGRLLVDANRNIFGVATVGGTNGVGTVFQMTPVGEAWDFTTLYSFIGSPGGVFPYGGLIRDESGNFYGTTYYGGFYGAGTAFQLSLVGGTWTENVLYTFKNMQDGGYPIGGLTFGKNGRLYGTASEGGASCSCGVIYELRRASGSWEQRVLHRFTGTPDGSYPYSGLLADPSGTMYGATVHGGDDDDGTVFSIKPRPPSAVQPQAR